MIDPLSYLDSQMSDYSQARSAAYNNFLPPAKN